MLVPAHKRTISINFHGGINRFFINFPKSLFVIKGDCRHLCVYSLNEKDELCHQPFLNISMSSVVCINGITGTKNLKLWVEKFFNTPFKLCYDHYADSLNHYFLLQPKTFKEELFGSGYFRNAISGGNQIESKLSDRITYRNNMISNITNFYNNFDKVTLRQVNFSKIQSYFVFKVLVS